MTPTIISFQRPRILVSNIGFGNASPASSEKLNLLGDVILNDEGIRFNDDDFLKHIIDIDIIIAGTEKITKKVLEKANNLKLIARVGVGIDNIDLTYAHEKKINICYTPDAPSHAMPEFTLALMLNLIKGIHLSNFQMHQKTWYRPMGRMLSSLTVGIVGVGKIGKAVIKLIHSLSPQTKILFYDPFVENADHAIPCTLEKIFSQSDIVSLHLPSTDTTHKLINCNLLNKMKAQSYLINTARGNIIDEHALYEVLKNKKIAGAALDVFESEPYTGPLAELDNCLTTAHIGSMTHEIRALMEEEVCEDIMRFIKKEHLLRPVPGFIF